jgi:hypothetical protein
MMFSTTSVLEVTGSAVVLSFEEQNPFGEVVCSEANLTFETLSLGSAIGPGTTFGDGKATIEVGSLKHRGVQ